MVESPENNETDFEIADPVHNDELYPIFPISNAVFFPKTILPLHIFEPRYKSLLKDVQSFGDKRFVLTGLITTDKPIKSKPDSLGVIVELLEEEQLPDGRANIVIQVKERVKIVDYFREFDLFSDDYAIGSIIRVPEEPIDSTSDKWLDLRKNLFIEFKTHFEKITKQTLQVSEESIAESFTPEESINTVCNITLLDYTEKQSLLYLDSLYERGIKILEIYRKLNNSSPKFSDVNKYYQ